MRAVVCVAAALGLVGAAPVLVGCGNACRSVTPAPLELQCADNASFLGELHFDDSASFESFVELACLPDADDATVARHVGSVDFSKDVAFVAVGSRPQGARCLVERSGAGVEICDAGLRVVFEDVEEETLLCTGKWTVAMALPRADMRAALSAP